MPDYYTYTLNTLQCYPIVTGTSSMPSCDDDNNIETYDASNCVGFNLHLQNYSFEAKFRFKSFDAGRFGIAIRMSTFNRVHGSDGYSVWFYQYGRVEMYRGTRLIAEAVCVPMIAERDYVIEFGAVDLNAGQTKVFVSVDNVSYIEFVDESPVQQPGYLNMNAEGNVTFTATSSDTKLTPGKIELIDDERTSVINVGFINSFSLTDMVYAEFSEQTLSSILQNGISVYDLNQICCTGEGGRAVDVNFSSNILQITLNKELYYISGEEYNFGKIESIELKKTRNGGGFSAPSGLVLKQSCFKNFV